MSGQQRVPNTLDTVNHSVRLVPVSHFCETPASRSVAASISSYVDTLSIAPIVTYEHTVEYHTHSTLDAT